MSTPADQLDAALKPPLPPVTPQPAPAASPVAAQPNNLSDAYMAHNDTMRGAAAAEQLDAMVKGQPTAANDAAPSPEAPPSTLSKIGSGAAAVGKDIGLGVIETPRAVVKGVRDAYQGMLDLTKEVGDFTNKYLPALQVTGKGAPRIVTPSERAADPSLPGSLADDMNLPDIGEPKSVTGTIEKNVVQFVTGMSAAGSQLKALGMPEVTGMGARAVTALKGFMGQFEAFDGTQKNLSNLVQSVPALENPITKFLATDPTDNDAVNRLKSAVEGTVGGQLVDAFVGGLRLLRSATAAKEAAEHATGLAEGNADLGEDIGPPSKGMTALGDVAARDEAPLVSARFNNAATKVADQEFTADGITPPQVVKMAEPAGASARPSGFIDTRGADEQFHGSPTELKGLSNNFYSTMNIYGQGLYTTDSAKIAESYTQKGLAAAKRDGTANPTVYNVATNSDVKLFDLADPVPDSVKQMLSGDTHYGADELAKRILEEDPTMSLRKLYDEVRAESKEEGHSADTVQEFFDSVRANLEKEGYQGFEHLGGKIIGNEEHNVKIYWNPGDDVKINKTDLSKYADIVPSKTPEAPLAGPASPGATEAQAKEPGVYVNFAKIDGPDDIKRAMSQMADAFKGSIDDARRGVQTFEDTKLGADAVNAWDTLMSRRVGEPLNAEQSLAARQLWASSAAKTMDLAGIATADPNPENLFAFRKMMATHAAIQEQVIAARTETARALSSWRIPAGAQDYRMAQMMAALKQDSGPASDGLSVSLNMAQRVKALQQAMDVDGLNNFTQKGVYATTRDAALEAWTNGLLTSPLTHVKVFVSNAATTALRIGERSLAEKYSSVLGDTNGVAVGEAGAQYSGLVSGLKDAFRYAGKTANAFLNEEPLPPLGNDPLSNAIKAAKTGHYSAGEQTPEHNFGGAISSQAFNISSSGWVGQCVDLLGQLVRSPGRALTAEHDFFRSIGYRMELNALATRQATGEVQAGKITEDALGGRIAEIMANPPPSVTTGSIDAMKYQTFTDAPGKLADLIEQARTNWPLLRVILPFYKIPSRILSFTFERSPLAPLMQSYQSNIAAGGSREALARAQMGLGTGLMLATADAVLSGQVTGSGPPEKSQRSAMMGTGWLPYSMKVGDHWVQYNKLETIGSSMAMAADVVETLHGYNKAVNGDDPEMGKLAVATALSIAQDITSKTYLEGLSRFFETLANPKTEGEAQARSMAGSVVPAGVAAVDRLQDPYQRTVYSMMDAIKARTPGLSESLPPRRDVWGDPIKHDSGMGKAYDLLSPFATREPADSPIDKEIVRLGANVNLPAAKVSFGQGAAIDLHKDPALYSRYVELAGNGYKDPAWGLGAKDLLNQIVSGNHPLSALYNMKSDGPEGAKAEMIHGIMNQYREGAKQQLLEENPKLQPQIDQQRASAQALKMPVTQ